MNTVVIEESLLSSAGALHAKLAASLGFPAYYGENLAALSDCLGDLDEPTLLVVRRSPAGRRRRWLDGFCRVFARSARGNPMITLRLEEAGAAPAWPEDTRRPGMLKLDFTQDATREGMLAQLLAQLDGVAQERIRQAVAPLAASGGHFHDVGEVAAAIDAQPFSERVKADARAVYRVLAQAEAQVHGCAVEETHFHEVGNADAVANVLGVCLAVEAIDPRCIRATRVQAGRGKVRCAHGLLDIPAPATAAILARGIPVCDETREGEWCTPTSAALILHFVDEFED